MAFGLGTIFYVSLLLVNAIAILNEERFLARIGWSSSLSPSASSHANHAPTHDAYGNYIGNSATASSGDQSVKARLVTLIGAVRMLLRVPLIILNIMVIVYEILLG